MSPKQRGNKEIPKISRDKIPEGNDDIYIPFEGGVISHILVRDAKRVKGDDWRIKIIVLPENFEGMNPFSKKYASSSKGYALLFYNWKRGMSALPASQPPTPLFKELRLNREGVERLVEFIRGIVKIQKGIETGESMQLFTPLTIH